MKSHFALAGAIGLTLLLSVLLLAPGASGAHAAMSLSPLTVSFKYAPSDPSIYDTVTFTDTTQAPPSQPFALYNWTFGDNGSGTGKQTTHQYAADGEYVVQDHVITGLSPTVPVSEGWGAQTLHVRTDDVEVTRVAAPAVARAGQRGSVLVSVSSKRYAEPGVTVQLQKSDAGGFSDVSSLTQPLPAPGAAPTGFSFSYVFSEGDGELGQVVFRAIATIAGRRDAQPDNNQLDAAATLVLEPKLYLPIMKKN